MSRLAEKIRAARRVTVDVGGNRALIAERPTDVQWYEMRNDASPIRWAAFVVDWQGFREMDLFVGGDPHPITEFDAAACREWLADNPVHLNALGERLTQAYVEHIEALDASGKP